MTAPEQIDRELARALRAGPLDERFDAAVLSRIEALPPQQAVLQHQEAVQQASGARERMREHLARERRELHVSLALYGIGAAALLAVIMNILSHVAAPAVDPAMQWLTALALSAANANVLAVPIAALAVIGSGAWLLARSRHLGVV